MVVSLMVKVLSEDLATTQVPEFLTTLRLQSFQLLNIAWILQTLHGNRVRILKHVCLGILSQRIFKRQLKN